MHRAFSDTAKGHWREREGRGGEREGKERTVGASPETLNSKHKYPCVFPPPGNARERRIAFYRPGAGCVLRRVSGHVPDRVPRRASRVTSRTATKPKP